MRAVENHELLLLRDVSFADHVLFADANVHVLDFFDAARIHLPWASNR
jgi:hypothetical protein